MSERIEYLENQLKAKDKEIEELKEHTTKQFLEMRDIAIKRDEYRQELKRLKEVLGKVDLVAELGQPIKINGNLHQMIKELIEKK